jgi:chorismate synthase
MNSFGTLFKITFYGESHSPSMGVVIDGVRSGLDVDLNKIKGLLTRRRPKSDFETPRVEDDDFEITSGVFNGRTNGGAINVVVKNTNYNSSKYDEINQYYRNSHVDYVSKKYGSNFDFRGSGFLSGRLSVLYVIAGYFACLVYPCSVESQIIRPSEEEVKKAVAQNDSIGGLIRLTAKADPFLGEPIFNKATSNISSLLFSVPSVKGVVFSDEIESIFLTGSNYADEIVDSSGKTKTNHSGGVNGGITNNNPLIVNCLIRPISSFGKQQNLFDKNLNKSIKTSIKGSHDLYHLERMRVILESVLRISLADLYYFSIFSKK